MSSREVIAILKQHGFELKSTKGSHQTFKHADGRRITVPHPEKDLKIGLVKAIEKATGIKLRG